MQAIRYLIKFFCVAACLAFLHGCAAPGYKVAVVAGPGSAGLGINNHGHTVGFLDVGGAATHAFVNTGASAVDIGTLGGANSRAWGINLAGKVVGESENAGGLGRAFLYDGGVMSDLGTLGGPTSYARAINDDGTIVGGAALADGTPRAFSYSNGAMANLGTLPSTVELYSYGYAINRRGEIAGSSSVGEFSLPEPPQHGFLRRTGGSMIDLGTFGGAYGEAFGINDKGQVVGVAGTSVLHFDNAFLYSGGVTHDIGNLGGGYAQAFDINNKSQVVGVSGGTTPDRAFLYQKGKMVALDTLIDPALGWTIKEARGINDHSQIVGTGCKAGVCFAVRLDPTK
jgi:probable HAF family extracellular repeat protein